MTEEKLCRSCNALKPLDDFPTDRTKRDGHHTLCKECKAIAEMKWVRQNRKRKAEIYKKYVEGKRLQKDGGRL